MLVTLARSLWRGAAWGSLAALATPGPPARCEAPAPGSPSLEAGARILTEAFERRFGRDLAARLRIVTRGPHGGTRTRELETVVQARGGHTRAIGRVTAPASLRGMTLLSVETRSGGEDVTVYLPALGRARKVTQPPGDAFLGTDLSYADLRRQRLRDYLVREVQTDVVDGETALRVITAPIRPRPWERVDFLVADSDRAVLGVDYHRGGPEPARILRVPRAAIRSFGRSRIPMRLEVRDIARGTSTRVEVLDLVVDPPLDDRLFSVVTLESERDIQPRAGNAGSFR